MYGRLYERARAVACSNCRGPRCHPVAPSPSPSAPVPPPDPTAHGARCHPDRVAVTNRARSTARSNCHGARRYSDPFSITNRDHDAHTNGRTAANANGYKHSDGISLSYTCQRPGHRAIRQNTAVSSL